MRSPILLLALSACAAVGQSGVAREQAALDHELAGRAASAPEKCVPALSNSALNIVDARTLTYRSGGTIWINRLRDTCPGLRPFDRLIVETYGSSYCQGDRIRSFEPHSSIAGPICVLGDFTPYRRR